MTPPPKPATPPRVAELAVRLASRRSERAFIVGDFRDAFDDHVGRSGVAAARAWYWREALRSRSAGKATPARGAASRLA